MSLSSNISEKAALIWAIADKLTGVYKPHEYGEVILPLTVFRRFDCILADTKEAVLEKYKNVFYINGHLHDGVYENSLEVLNEENGVYSINLPAYGRENDYGEFLQDGLGTYVEVYDDEVIFTARDFKAGKSLEGYTKTFELVK